MNPPKVWFCWRCGAVKKPEVYVTWCDDCFATVGGRGVVADRLEAFIRGAA